MQVQLSCAPTVRRSDARAAAVTGTTLMLSQSHGFHLGASHVY